MQGRFSEVVLRFCRLSPPDISLAEILRLRRNLMMAVAGISLPDILEVPRHEEVLHLEGIQEEVLRLEENQTVVGARMTRDTCTRSSPS